MSPRSESAVSWLFLAKPDQAQRTSAAFTSVNISILAHFFKSYIQPNYRIFQSRSVHSYWKKHIFVTCANEKNKGGFYFVLSNF